MIAIRTFVFAAVTASSFIAANVFSQAHAAEPSPATYASATAGECVPGSGAAKLALENNAWLVELSVSGGLAYRHSDALVRSDGQAVVDGCPATLETAALKAIAAAAANAQPNHWKRLRTDCCDQITADLKFARNTSHGSIMSEGAYASATVDQEPADYRALVNAVSTATTQFTAYEIRMRHLMRSPAPAVASPGASATP